MSEFKLPTENVSLPSKGKFYPKDSLLAEGKIEMKYMTAKEEDILTNQNFIKQGTVIDKLMKSLIVSDIDYTQLLTGDKNAIMVAARILSYGKDYEFTYDGQPQSVDLSQFDSKPLHEEVENATENNFHFVLPHTKNEITFKLLSHSDESKIDREIKGLKKINKQGSSDVTVRLYHMITSINGSTERKDIKEFVDNYFLAKDARAFRQYYTEISPDIDLSVTLINSEGDEEDTELPIGLNFFWPDA